MGNIEDFFKQQLDTSSAKNYSGISGYYDADGVYRYTGASSTTGETYTPRYTPPEMVDVPGTTSKVAKGYEPFISTLARKLLPGHMILIQPIEDEKTKTEWGYSRCMYTIFDPETGEAYEGTCQT